MVATPGNLNEQQIDLRHGGNFDNLPEFLNCRTVKAMPFINTAISVVSSPFALLPAGSFPGVLAVGATALNNGQIVAALGAWTAGTGASDLTVLTGPNGETLNRVNVRSKLSHDPIIDADGREIFGLITVAAGTLDGDSVAANPNENLQVTFIVDVDGVFTARTLDADVEIRLNKIYAERFKKDKSFEGTPNDTETFYDVPKEADYRVTSSCTNSSQLLELATGDLTGSSGMTGTSTGDIDYIYLSTWLDSQLKFDDDKTVFFRNGDSIKKGLGFDVEYVAPGIIKINFPVDTGDLIGMKTQYVYTAGVTAPVAITVTENSVVIDSNVDTLDFTGSIAVTQTAPGKVNINVTGGTSAPTINAQTGTSYTPDLTDAFNIVTLDNILPITLTVPRYVTVAFVPGTCITFLQKGAGKVTFQPFDGSVTILSKALNMSMAAQNVGVSLVNIDTNIWVLLGDLIV